MRTPKVRSSAFLLVAIGTFICGLVLAGAMSTGANAQRPIANPTPFVADALEDQSHQTQCVFASTLPTNGMLLPLGEQFYVDTLGNVGIGTTTPAADLHVRGNLCRQLTGLVTVAAGSTDVYGVNTLFTQELVVGCAIGIANQAFTVLSITTDTHLVIDEGHSSGAVDEPAFADTDLFLVENGDSIQSIVVDAVGKIGIGRTPGHDNNKVYVNGSLSLTNPAEDTIGSNIISRINSDYPFVIKAGRNAGSSFSVEIGPDLPSRLFINSSGNVGIGLTDPQRRLHINDVIRLEPRSSAPSSPGEGDLYVDSSDHHIYCYLNGTWKQLD
ncbi:MAG: hypothetical protein AB1486_17875 [Planctomycetota bacterium]